MVEAAWLAKNGIDLDKALSLPDEVRTALSIIFSEFTGAKFNWDRFEFEKESSV